MQNENKDMLRKSKVRILIPVLSFGLLLSTLTFYGQTMVGGSHAAPALIKHQGAISSASHGNYSRVSASGLVVADTTQVAVALPMTTPTTLIAAATPMTDSSANNPATTADTSAATATTADAPAATMTTANNPVTTADVPAATMTTANNPVTTANTPAATMTTASNPATTANTPAAAVTTASATATTASASGSVEDVPPRTVTVWVQTIDSCRQAIGGAFYTLSSLPDGQTLQVVGPVPGIRPVTVSSVGGCPIPRGNCLTIMTGCISFVLPVPATGQSNFTITETKAPKGFVPCLKATKCLAPAKVNVTVSSTGAVTATTTIVLGNGQIVTFPSSQMLPTFDGASDGSNPSNPTTIVVQDERMVEPASATTLSRTDDPGAAFTMTPSDPALVYNNQICSGKNKKSCEGKGMVVRAVTKVAVGIAHSQPVNVKRTMEPVKPAR